MGPPESYNLAHSGGDEGMPWLVDRETLLSFFSVGATVIRKLKPKCMSALALT
jgi:hypothetical protein